jgi:UDP-2,3-diacylglucosamine pyrophosphatase LpxH
MNKSQLWSEKSKVTKGAQGKVENGKNEARGKVRKMQPYIIDPTSELLYVDVGAWQGKESEGDFETNFVLVSGRGIAFCNFCLTPSLKESNFRGKSVSPETLLDVGDVLEDPLNGDECKLIYDFLCSICPKGSYYLDYVQYFYATMTEENGKSIRFWDKNSLLIIIGDLHLHLFRQYNGRKKVLVDNFIKVEKGERKSLEEDFCEFLAKIVNFKKTKPKIKIVVVQVGDMVDIWEIRYIFNTIARYMKGGSLTARTRRQARKFLRHYRSIGVLKEDFTLDKTGLMKYMQERVFAKLFDKINELKALKVPFIMLQGNHDYALFNDEEFNDGPDYLIHIEHGHRFDSSNKPGSWFGRILTGVVVDFEFEGHGDFFKSLEDAWNWLRGVVTWPLYVTIGVSRNQREIYIRASKDVNSWFEKNKQKKLSAFIMGHSHRPYVQKITR